MRPQMIPRRYRLRGLRLGGYAEIPLSASLPPGGVMQIAPAPAPPLPDISSPILLPPILSQPVAESTKPSGVVYDPKAPWIEPPPEAEAIDPVNWATLTAAVSTIVVLDFTVPEGRDGVIKLFGMQVFGAGWTEGTTQLVWRILIDGQPVRNYSNILASLGNVGNPAPLGGRAGLRIFEGNRVQVICVNNAVVAGGQQLGARMGGWYYSKTHDQSGW